MTSLDDYAFETLWAEDELVLSRARSESAASVLVVSPASSQPQSSTLRRLENALLLRDVLDSRWATRPRTIAQRRALPHLVLDDPGGDVLARRVEVPLEMGEFLRVSVGLAGALRQLHERGVVHKDIKPSNVLAEPATGAVWLTGFGTASRSSRERQSPNPIIDGTLAYMAPEQTGRMNRSVDSRSDLYALGVTLYELLAGRLPFTAQDPMEWIHCHIARQPAPLRERLRGDGVPPLLDKIVTKLLAKSAEDRYQTSAGVEADLRRCCDQWKSSGVLANFSLGTHDLPERLSIPEKLYGRDPELDFLVDSFKAVADRGTCDLALVAGNPGVGKSALVNELHQALVPSRALVAAGKFDQYKRDIPYVTLTQAFETLVRHILARSNAEVVQWRRDLREALGSNGRLVVNLVPELELIVGSQPAVPDLPPQDAKTRMMAVLTRFISVFATPSHPLVLFLDDLQWIDAASLELLTRLIVQGEVRYLLLIGAYRDNEVGPSHALTRALAELRAHGKSPREVVLAPLTAKHVEQLLADSLHVESSETRALAALIHEKTAGNPFFSRQFVSSLADDGLLAFDSKSRAWAWDVDQIRGKGCTDNVVALVLARLGRLPDATRQTLVQFAALGSTADVATLANVCARSAEDVRRSLDDIAESGLLFRSGDTYSLIHDRVQEAAYALIPADQRAATHLRIGRILCSTTGYSASERVFEVVNQLNKGAALIEALDERDRVAELNLAAGRRAIASTAYASASSYLATGLQLLGEAFDRRPELSWNLNYDLTSCELVTGKLDTAESRIALLQLRATSRAQTAAAYGLRIELHVLRSENALAVEAALECLRGFDIEMHPHPSNAETEEAYDRMWNALRGRSIQDLIQLPRLADPDVEAAMQVLGVLYAPATFTDANLARLHLCHMVLLTLEHGVTAASAHAFGWLGITLADHFGRYEEAYSFGALARDLVERHDFAAFRAKSLFSLEIVSVWRKPLALAIDCIKGAFASGLESGDVTVSCYACNHLVSDKLERGDHLDEVWSDTERGLAFAKRANFQDVVDILVAQQRFIEALRGHTSSLASFDGEGFDEAAFEATLTPQRMSTMVCWYWILKGQTRFIEGDLVRATQDLDRAAALIWSSPAHIQNFQFHFYSALALLGLRSDDTARLDGHRRHIERWSATCPETFSDKRALVEAEVARVEGRHPDAIRLYEEATRTAIDRGFVHIEALAGELAGRFHDALGATSMARACMRSAWLAYQRWGASAKAEQLSRQMPYLRAERVPVSPKATVLAGPGDLDLATAIQISQAVSAEIRLDRLIERLMRIALEHAGADRGLLIVVSGDDPIIESEALTGAKGIEVRLRSSAVGAAELPESVLRYVIRTRETVILDDASSRGQFAEDAYIVSAGVRSVMAVPLLKQAALIGVLLLENKLTPSAFTPGRVALLGLLAAQAAISLENARLYTEVEHSLGALRQSEAFSAEAQQLSRTGSFGWNVATGTLVWSEETYRIFGIERGASPTVDDVLDRTHPEDATYVRDTLERAARGAASLDFEHRLLMPDGAVRRLHVLGRPVRAPSGALEYIGAAMDVTDQRDTEAALQQAQSEVARVMRVMALGELAASIAHEVSQPLAAVESNVSAAMNWLAFTPPATEQAREALGSARADSARAGEVLSRIRAMLARSPLELVACDLNAVVASALSLIRHQFERRGISLEAALAAEPPVVWGDSVQLQQLLLNLLLNAADACDGLGVDRRRVEVRTAVDNAWALLTVADAGKGIEPSVAERLFDAFFTTKPEGLGIGLSISRSITDRHGGTLAVTSNKDYGVTFVARVRLASSTASTAGPNDTKRGSGVASCSPEHSSP